MRQLLSVLVMLALASGAWAEDRVSLDPLEPGVAASVREGLWVNHDGSFENGVAWQNDGCVAPDYGAFAECFDLSAEGMIISVTFWLTQLGDFAGESADVYVWEGSPPGNVLAVVPGVVFEDIAIYPEFSEHTVTLSVPVNGVVSVGYWGNWPGLLAPFYCAADQDGPGSPCPWTKIAPDIGFPDGWQHPNVAWASVVALGIGVTTENTTAAARSSWSTINALY